MGDEAHKTLSNGLPHVTDIRDSGTFPGVMSVESSKAELLRRDSGSDLFVKKTRRSVFILVLLGIVLLLALSAIALSIVALIKASDDNNDDNEFFEFFGKKEFTDGTGLIHRHRTISKIAFGSCTTYYLYPQRVWTTGVVAVEPDAWIWTGDFVYSADSHINCRANPDSPDCNCPMELLTWPPYACWQTNVSHATEKLADNDYKQFLEYMCPNYGTSVELAPFGAGCKRPILGTYDDHDFGMNNGNRHMPNKYEFKNLYLDSIGEPQNSVRRSRTHGLQFKYTLNAKGPLDRRIDIFVLDERYERDSLPCGVRRESCEDILKEKPDPMTHDYMWCEDFLKTGGDFGIGSCCAADDIWANGWCKDNPDSKDPLWDVACDPTSHRFGMIQIEVDPDDATKLKKKTNYDDLASALNPSTFCEVLGPKQREWLRKGLKESTAPLKLVVSGSVVFGNPTHENWNGLCSGDDIECYKVAQANLAHIVGNVDHGCAIVLTGDYHVSDFKLLKPGKHHPYSPYYPTETIKNSILQVMSSGLTETTAKNDKGEDSCQGWAKDEVGLRPLGECSVVVKPSFGTMEVNWKKNRVSFNHRSIDTGKTLNAFDGTKQHIAYDLKTCKVV